MTLKQRVLDYLSQAAVGPVYPVEVSEHLGITRKQARDTLRYIEKRGAFPALTKVRRGVWQKEGTRLTHLHDDGFKVRSRVRLEAVIESTISDLMEMAERTARELIKIVDEEFAPIYESLKDIPHICHTIKDARCVNCGAEVWQGFAEIPSSEVERIPDEIPRVRSLRLATRRERRRWWRLMLPSQ
jgi:hypothetical protein